MKIGYIFSREGDSEAQEASMVACDCDCIIYDASVNRSKLTDIIESLVPGSILVSWRVDKIADSIKELSCVVRQLKAKDAALKLLQEGVLIDFSESSVIPEQLIDIMLQIEQSV